MKSLSVFLAAAVATLACVPIAQANNPLEGLVSNRGAATVEYERAVGKRVEFDRLSTAGPAGGVAVSLVGDTSGQAGPVVAAAYTEGLVKVLPRAALASAWGAAPPPQFVAEVGVSERGGIKGESGKVIMAAQGTTCMMAVDKKMQCTEAPSAPDPLGKKGATGVNPAIMVKIRLYRHDREDTSSAPVLVFEDAYSVSYVASECPDPAVAAATVARLLGESVMNSRAVNISFPTTPRKLSCNAKA